jgi:regulator of protease activity HflC (stomatin/prohibitin superfamily)
VSETSDHDHDHDRSAAALFKSFGQHKDRLWIAGAALTLALIGMRSCSSIDPGQVAVRVNNATGGVETVTQPGMILRLPFGIHSVYRLDASQQSFHMKGDSDVNDLEVRHLTVRAKDGSNFVFGDTTILFQLIGSQANSAIDDAGLAHRYRMWMIPYARSILRDEFGQLTTIQASNPADFDKATNNAKTRLNKLLNPHGLEIVSIVTPKPNFSDEYENLIEARNQTENQLAVIDSELQRAATDRQRQIAEVQRDQNQAIQEKKADLESQLAVAQTKYTQTRRDVDSYKIDTIAKGQADLAAAQRTAEELKGQLTAQYQQKKAEIDAFRNQPVERVMQKLGEKLEGVTIKIQPWASDASPKRVQYEQLGGAQ